MSLAAAALAGCGASEQLGQTTTVASSTTATTTASVPTTTVATSAAPAARARGEITSGPVVYVSDGDTVGVRLGGVVTRIRLLGIDAPETKDPDQAPQCYGPQAAAHALRLMPRRSIVTVVTDPTQDRVDKFGRLLAYVFPVGRPKTVNEALVRAGAARVYVYRRKYPPKRLAELRAAEREAKAARRGLWGACTK